MQRSIRAAHLARASQLGRKGGKNVTLSASAAALAATPPQFEPVRVTKPPRLVYPEDRLREVYLSRNPSSRRLPVDMGARTVSERHVADRFVALQMQLMEEHGVSEDVAYLKAERIMAAETSKLLDVAKDDMSAPLINESIKDPRTRLYLASFCDSQRDARLREVLVNQGAAAPASASAAE